MRRRGGFTLIELLVTIVLLTIVATTFAKFAGSFARAMGDSTIKLVATEFANSRLELIRSDPRYTRLNTLYGSGAGADTTGFGEYPRMRRVTQVVRDQSGERDRTTVTVTVTDPALQNPVAVTAVIASE